ncbi:hypothetical protein [Microbacterium sp. BK668]|uniref:hypothetical protein n=1 Tax=Microbacterium sp. BK668 TaxID=2512118 RepID=UPI00105D34B3|nr:hypothetical protein [Microbacterium sp. BK668]TDN88676.1 hypothetical protein EV279_3121 [Microbacterium sp. BK668]
MIAAGLVLLAVGAADLVREFLPAARRWIGLLAGAVVLVIVGALADALVAALGAVAVAALWVWLSPVGGRARAGFWPAVALGALCGVLLATVPPRGGGLIGGAWALATPVGVVTFDHTVLVVGIVVFLMESANVVVRAALQQENVELARVSADPPVAGSEASPALPDEAATDASAPAEASITPAAPGAGSAVEPALKGGRLIGPLERILVFALTLAAMYPLLAAVLAAKGIVRFPEISRDSAAGNRAEYFLIGSLVSWVIALAGAFLVWWAFATP